ncbi:MAG: ABC transporter ATP-binding protein, partial [Lachnospiraceae bacterium]|nr:ABC transporter ATP-binding protein [Lachnospiraceae bacterium]
MLKKISYVLDNRQKRNLFILLIVILVGAFVELLGVSSILPIVNVALEPETIEKTWYLVLVKETMGFTDARQMLVFLALMLIVIYIVKNIYITVMYSLQYRFIFNNQKRLAVKMMDCYMRQNYIFHVSKNVAELQRNVTNDVNGFFTVVLNALQFLAEFSVCAVLSIFLLQSDVITTLAVAGLIMIFGMLFTFVFKRVLVQKGERNRELNVQTTKWILQSFSGIKEIKVANSENFFIYNYDKNYSQFAVLQRQQSMLKFIPRPVMESVCICGLLLAIIIKTKFAGADLKSFIPTLSVFAIAAFRMLPSFNRITGNLGSIMFDKPAIDSVYHDLVEIEELMKQKQVEKNTFDKIVLKDRISMEKVSFHYPESDKMVLQDANLTIKKNSSVAFIGASGAGKTTVVDLILGLLEPQNGKITVDGKNINTHMESWHQSIGYIPQTIYLMDDTIRANIAFGIPENEINEKLLMQAVKEAQLDQFINSLPDGLDTVIGDRGVRLSGGQRQRIGIARALYRD